MVSLLLAHAHDVFAASDLEDASNIPAVQQSEPPPLTLDTRAMSDIFETKEPLTRHLFDGPVLFKASSGQIVQGQPYPYPYPYPVYPHHHHDGSIAAIMIGAAAAITGTAVLIYANRPECTFAPYAGGCGYGTKVVGGSVLAGGIVGLFVGALTW
jgi:hypothetical protein